MIFFQSIRRFKSKIINKNIFKISDDIDFGKNISKKYFKNKLKKSKFYFEYGSGSSTLYADKMKKKFISIELDKKYFSKIKKFIKKDRIRFINMGPVGEFSYPIFKNKKKIISYVEYINYFLKKKNNPDLILIDGRFRVACCINLLRFINKDYSKVSILLDDYKKRKHYKIIRNFFYVKEIGRMAVLKTKKKKFNRNIYNKYLLDPR